MKEMGQLLLITTLGSLILTLLLVPVTRKVRNRELTMKQFFIIALLTFVVSFISVFITVYLTKIDLNWTIMLYALPVFALIGAILTVGFEQKIKSVIVLIGIIGFGYLLITPLLNAEEKYESAKMEEKVEISAFDETKTPASVPPKFAKNKIIKKQRKK